MKLKKITAILIMSLLLLVGCRQDSQYENISQPESDVDRLVTGNKELNDKLHVIKDNKTGCKYMLYRERTASSGTAGLVPLMNPDGTQDCEVE